MKTDKHENKNTSQPNLKHEGSPCLLADLMRTASRSHQFNTSPTQLCQKRGGVWMFYVREGKGSEME